MKSVKLISSAIAMLVCFVTMAQQRTITGIVSDETKQPLPGVTIFNQTSKANALTNFDGQYSIQAQKGDVLVFISNEAENQHIASFGLNTVLPIKIGCRICF